jgi:hypothetical protein
MFEDLEAFSIAEMGKRVATAAEESEELEIVI